MILRKFKLGIADGLLKADGKMIYTATDLRVGLFKTGEAAPRRCLICRRRLTAAPMSDVEDCS